MDVKNQDVKDARKSVKVKKEVKGKATDIKPTKTSKSLGKKGDQKSQGLKAFDDILDEMEVKSEPEVEMYHEDAILKYISQDEIPDSEIFAINLSDDLQISLFGSSAASRLQKKRNSMALQPETGTQPEKKVLDDEVYMPKPSPYTGLSIEKAKLLDTLANELTDNSLDQLKEKANEYHGSALTFIADDSKKFGGNFILILSQEVDNTLRIEELEILSHRSEEEDVIEEADDLTAQLALTKYRPWISGGSEKEIIRSSFFESRARVVTKFERPRKDFGAPIFLSDLNSAQNYTEVKPYEEKSFEIPIIQQERGVSCTNLASDTCTNTEWRYPRNQIVQYMARTLNNDEVNENLVPKSSLRNITNLLPLFEQGLKQNLMFDFLTDDYENLAPGDDTYDNKSGNTFKEVYTFTDLKFSKDKAVTHIEWHPAIDGLIAMSVGEKLTYDERVDQASRVLLTPSFILIWSFFEPIQPQLLLEAPEDIMCFQFCPSNPLIVAGGCYNGEVILWDISKYEYDLCNVLERVRSKTKVPLFQFDENDALKVPISPWCAASNLEASHSNPITQIEWVPNHLELNRNGFAMENLSRSSIQLITCATEGGILFWDIRPDKSPLAVDKTRDQLIMPKNVPKTFAALDAKWKPFLRVTLFRPDNGPDHCPTHFCLKERQGDPSILSLRANVKKKLAAESDPSKVGLPKQQPLDGLNSHLYAGTEDGDMVFVDWVPQKDTQSTKMQTTMPTFFAQQHDGPVSYISRSPFLSDVLLCVGGWSWSLWREGIHSEPLLSSCTASKALTGGLWSPSRPSVFYIIRADGTLESWDLLDKTHEPALMQSVSASALTAIAIKVESKKHLLAIGDMHGALRVLIIPHRMKVCGSSEQDAFSAYIERETKRRAFVIERSSQRERERIEKENEMKRLAGISTVATLTAEEKRQKLKVEYDEYLKAERQFLRSLGLFDDDIEFAPVEELVE